MREYFAERWPASSKGVIRAGVTQGSLIEVANGILDEMSVSEGRYPKRRALLDQLETELVALIPEEPLDESSPVGFDPERRPNETPADRKYSRGSLSESALRQITQRVAARMNGISPTNKRRIVETVTNRVAARLIAEAKKAKKGGIKEKMHAKKKLKEGSKGAASKNAPKGNGPGKKNYGVKGKVANEYSLKSVKLPKNSGGQDTVVAKGGKAKTVPQGAGKKGGKGNTTN
jgi:hypothetical protein